MAEYSEEVKKLAETLKESGLAASMMDALQRAQSMVSIKSQNTDQIKVEKEKHFGKEENGPQTKLNDNNSKEEMTMGEFAAEEQKTASFPTLESDDSEEPKEEVFANRPSEINIEENQEKIDDVSSVQQKVQNGAEETQKKDNPINTAPKENKKVDLSEMFNVNK